MGSNSVVQFNLLDPGKKLNLAVFLGTLSSVTCFLISYVNNNIFDYGSLIGMGKHLLQVRTHVFVCAFCCLLVRFVVERVCLIRFTSHTYSRNV